MRAHLSPPEEIGWEWLRRNQVNGLKVRRQCPLGSYIADYYCHALRLVIEVDGQTHNEESRREHDQIRDAKFAAHGIRTVRLSARSVLESPLRTQRKLTLLLLRLQTDR